MSMDRTDPKQRAMQREARRRQKNLGIKYTEALRQVKLENGITS